MPVRARHTGDPARAIRDALGVTYDALLEDSSAQKTAQ